MSKHHGHRNPWPQQKKVIALPRAPQAAQPRKAQAVVMIGTPTYNGQLAHQYLTSYVGSFTDCVRRDILIAPEFAVAFSLVQYARNWIVYQFLKNSEFTHLMWVDSDLGWQHNSIGRLVESGKDIIGGSYTTKSPTKPIYPFVATGPVDERGVQEVSSLPGGFVLMSRRAVQALWDASPEMVMEHGGEDHVVRHVCDLEFVTSDEKGNQVRRLLGEDYVMQVKLRSLGFRMYLQTDIDFVHVGFHEYLGNVAKAYEHEKQLGLKTMWHESAWEKNPRTDFDPRPDVVLSVPENEVPTPHTLDMNVVLPQEQLAVSE